jgi:hypothetical protein
MDLGFEMATKTTHIMPSKATGRWIVKKAGAKGIAAFNTRKEAIEVAKRSVKGKSGQVVVHTEDGEIIPVKVTGLPKVQKPLGKGTLEEKAIEKAVSKVVRKRLAISD